MNGIIIVHINMFYRWHEKFIGEIVFLASAVLLLGLIWLASLVPQAFGFTSNTQGVPTSTMNAIGNPAPNGLIGWWTMDGQDMIVSTTSVSSTILDHSGSGYNGTVSTSTPRITGVLGQAYNFNGVTNGANAGGQSVIDLGNIATSTITGPFSLSMWVKYTETSSTVTEFAFRWSGNYGIRMYKGINSTSMTCSFHPADGSLPTVTSTMAQNDGRWHLEVCTYDQVQLKLYSDDVLSLGDSTSSVPVFPTSNATIGRGAEETVRPFKGAIDDVRLYNRALTAAEAHALYQQAQTQINVSANSVSTSLVGWWSFDGPTLNVSSVASSTMLDLSGNGFTMTAQTTTAGAVVTTGKIGQGGTFAKSNYWNTLNPMASTSVLLPTSTNVSISLWAKFFDISATGMMYRCSGNFGYRMREVTATGLVNFSFFDSASNLYTVNSPNAMNDGRWHHYVGAYDHTKLYLYVDGALVTTSSAVTADIWYQTNVCGIGHNAGEIDTFPFTGQLDDVKIYSKALSATEVSSLYNFGK